MLYEALQRQPVARDYRFVYADLPPVYGALSAAAAHIGVAPQEEFQAHFIERAWQKSGRLVMIKAKGGVNKYELSNPFNRGI